MTSGTERSPTALGALAVLLVAAAYFAIGCTRSLEYIDEGQIIYPSWLVAGGAVPYEDFRHLYGPALFTFNGALLRWFGTDLLVIRISLVVLKAVTVALTYLLASRLASRRFALLSVAVLTAVWGTPVWIFNSPYANHYSMTLTLVGLLGFLALPRRFRLACAVAGLCFGLASTFKQTAGAFALCGFVLFLILDRDALEHPDLPAGPPLPDWCVRGIRLAVLAAMFGFFALYLSPRNTIWNVLVVLTPGALTIAVAFARELRGPVRPGMRTAIVGMFWAALGAALPITAVALFYAARGSLRAIFFNLVYGQPQTFTWFDPFPPPQWSSLFMPSLVAASFVLVAIGRRLAGAARAAPTVGLDARAGGPPPARRMAMLLGGVMLAALLVAGFAVRARLIGYLVTIAWQGPIIAMWSSIPFVAIWLTALQLLRSPPRAGEAPTAGRSLVLLVYCNAATSTLLFYPAADFLHLFMDLPAFAPLCALLLERFYRRPQTATDAAGPAGRWAAAAVIVALAAMMAAPLIVHLRTVYVAMRGDPTTVSRATGIRSVQPKFGEVAALVAHLDGALPPRAPMLALNCEQMLYFLTGRRSAAEQNEFAFYMICAAIISDEDARWAVDEQQLIAALAETKPLLIEGGERRTDGRLRRVFAVLSRYLDAHYEVAATVANYRVLRWAR